MNDKNLVTPFDTRTGKQLSRQVPRNWVGHPILGPHYTLTEPKPKPPASAPKQVNTTEGA